MRGSLCGDCVWRRMNKSNLKFVFENLSKIFMSSLGFPPSILLVSVLVAIWYRLLPFQKHCEFDFIGSFPTVLGYPESCRGPGYFDLRQKQLGKYQILISIIVLWTVTPTISQSMAFVPTGEVQDSVGFRFTEL